MGHDVESSGTAWFCFLYTMWKHNFEVISWYISGVTSSLWSGSREDRQNGGGSKPVMQGRPSGGTGSLPPITPLNDPLLVLGDAPLFQLHL